MIEQSKMLNDVELVFQKGMRKKNIVQPFAQEVRGHVKQWDDSAEDRFAHQQQLIHPLMPGHLPRVHAISRDDQRGTENLSFKCPQAVRRAYIANRLVLAVVRGC